MKNTIVFLVLSLAVALGMGFAGAGSAEAQVASPFPAGCSSALGYSVTTGSPCNGTNVATNGPLPGCTTALGYSVTNGAPCSGSSTVLSYLAGCSSVDGYSTVDGKACNGTAVASFPGSVTPPTTTPGLPRTGDGGNAFGNVLLLSLSGLIALGGLIYLVRKPKIT